MRCKIRQRCTARPTLRASRPVTGSNGRAWLYNEVSREHILGNGASGRVLALLADRSGDFAV
jgi:hypothetical protein